MYNRNLKKFLDFIPNNIFEEYLGKSPKSRDIEDLVSSFIELTKKMFLLQNLVSNLRPLQLENNANRQDGKLKYPITSDGKTNIRRTL